MYLKEFCTLRYVLVENAQWSINVNEFIRSLSSVLIPLFPLPLSSLVSSAPVFFFHPEDMEEWRIWAVLRIIYVNICVVHIINNSKSWRVAV